MSKSKTENLISIQPYFVMESDDFCQSILVKNGISHFFSFSNKLDEDITIPLLVDGCSNIIFEYKDNTVRTHFIGSTIEIRTFSIKKRAEYFGVRLLPTGTAFIKEIPVKDAIGKIIILDDLPSMKSFCKKMGEQTSFDSRMKLFLEEYPKFRAEVINNDNQAELFNQITDIIIQKKGKVKISELESLVGYSSRYINKIFDKEIGMSTKQFCNSVKFQFLLSDLNKGEQKSFTNLSSEYNFYDQAHFIHEFKEFSGKTPSEYSNELENNQYKESVTTLSDVNFYYLRKQA